MEQAQSFKEHIDSIIAGQRSFFAGGATRDIRFRQEQLRHLKSAVSRFERRITDALWTDLHKSPEESWLTEISLVLQEINLHIRRLPRWAKPQRTPSPRSLWPSKSTVIHEPLGNALIVAPWNYPFQLLFNPLVGAISSGCCAILKSSPYVPTVAAVMEELIAETFPANYISLVNGHREVNQYLFEQKFDIIFFTGSPDMGKVVMRAAAEHLTPVVLELGGKSPCIVDKTADLDLAARRIAWGKSLNAGQTCVAPDYLFIHADHEAVFCEKYGKAIERMFGNNPQESPCFPHIVSDRAMQRLQALLRHGSIIMGGRTASDERYIAPTLLAGTPPDSPAMQTEIFGPIMPVIPFRDIAEVISHINSNPKPLALYYFGDSKTAGQVLAKVSSGGACINDTILHVANHRLPFGGVGASGMGKYHGKDSFLAFTNRRAVVKSPTLFDLPFRYPPFRYFSTVKRIV